jgi:hypothetical protein
MVVLKDPKMLSNWLYLTSYYKHNATYKTVYCCLYLRISQFSYLYNNSEPSYHTWPRPPMLVPNLKWGITSSVTQTTQGHTTEGQRLMTWRMLSSGMLHSVAPVRTNVSEECITSIIRVTRIDKLGTTAVTSNWSKLWRHTMALCYNDLKYHGRKWMRPHWRYCSDICLDGL